MERITQYCTGCRACEQLCPRHSIRMKPDQEGFLTAVIDSENCVDCGLCAKRCPQNRDDLQHETVIDTLAVRLKDEKTLYHSASGGAFAGLALHAIRQGGIAFGVRWSDDYTAYHAKAETENEIWSLLSSKYVQADTMDSFTEVKRLLKNGRKVLYSGTGCQVAGLKAFLGREYDNLITIDLVCHGVPSPLLFRKYIEMLTGKHGARIEEYNFRDKSGGWGLGYKYKYKYKYKYGLSYLDPYFKYFVEGNNYRMCCYSCKYANTHRCGDITIADFWGIEKYHMNFFSTKGVSLMLINSEKGKAIWDENQTDFYVLKSKLEYAIKDNPNLRKPTSLKPNIRAHIYDGINTLSPEVYFTQKFPLNVSILDYLKSIVPMNFKYVLKMLIWKVKRMF